MSTTNTYRIAGTAIEIAQENGTWLWENTQGEGWSGGFASPIDAANHWSKTYGVPLKGLRRIIDHQEGSHKMTTTYTTPTDDVRHARYAEAMLATADALYTLAKQAEELAASENGSGPLSDEARRLFRAVDEYQADGDDEAQRAIALGYAPDEDDL